MYHKHSLAGKSAHPLRNFCREVPYTGREVEPHGKQMAKLLFWIRAAGAARHLRPDHFWRTDRLNWGVTPTVIDCSKV